jgi:hypothetical protein
MTDALPDRQAIGDQLARYAHAFDSRDVEGWAGLFTEDGVFEVRLGPGDQPVFRAQGAEQLRAFAGSAPRMLHHFSSLVFDELLAESARTRAVAFATWISPEDGPSVRQWGGAPAIATAHRRKADAGPANGGLMRNSVRAARRQ